MIGDDFALSYVKLLCLLQGEKLTTQIQQLVKYYDKVMQAKRGRMGSASLEMTIFWEWKF